MKIIQKPENQEKQKAVRASLALTVTADIAILKPYFWISLKDERLACVAKLKEDMKGSPKVCFFYLDDVDKDDTEEDEEDMDDTLLKPLEILSFNEFVRSFKRGSAIASYNTIFKIFHAAVDIDEIVEEKYFVFPKKEEGAVAKPVESDDFSEMPTSSLQHYIKKLKKELNSRTDDDGELDEASGPN